MPHFSEGITTYRKFQLWFRINFNNWVHGPKVGITATNLLLLKKTVGTCLKETWARYLHNGWSNTALINKEVHVHAISNASRLTSKSETDLTVQHIIIYLLITRQSQLEIWSIARILNDAWNIFFWKKLEVHIFSNSRSKVSFGYPDADLH
jgi:hypothetical protein